MNELLPILVSLAWEWCALKMRVNTTSLMNNFFTLDAFCIFLELIILKFKLQKWKIFKIFFDYSQNLLYTNSSEKTNKYHLETKSWNKNAWCSFSSSKDY